MWLLNWLVSIESNGYAQSPAPSVSVTAYVGNARLHDRRHSFATLVASEGVPIPVIAKLLGHSTVWTTTRYLHASRVMTAQTAHEVADLIIHS